jgi:membrane protease subunit (stomatin/prohibitin family)
MGVVEMPFIPFTRNYADNSTEAGFEFTFFCDVCNDGYKTSFIESKTYKKAGLLRGLGRAASIGSSVLGRAGGYQVGLCTEDAPRAATEIAAARATQRKEQIWKKAEETQVFTGEIKATQTLCPQCGKPAGTGKFCTNCGAPLAMLQCPKCGAQNAPGTRFCGECGNKL